MYIPDYNDLFEQHEARKQRELDKLPKCCECKEPIQSEVCFKFNDKLICPECLVDNHRKRTEDYVE